MGLHWNNRPALTSGAADNKTAFGANSWVEYDVTSLMIGSGTYTFALVADSTDGVVFSSREGTTPPQLVVTSAAGSPTHQQFLPPQILRHPPPPLGLLQSSRRPLAALRWWAPEILQTAAARRMNRPRSCWTIFPALFSPPAIMPTWMAPILSISTAMIRPGDRHKSRTKPSPGNHDYLTSGAAGYFQYFNNIAFLLCLRSRCLAHLFLEFRDRRVHFQPPGRLVIK